MSKTTTDSHSEIKTNFKNWLNNWDDLISTHDDIYTQEITRKKYIWCIATINRILSETDDKVMEKHTDNESKVKAMFKNQEKQFYKDLKKVADFMTCEMMRIENLYELKNRKSYENFRLRADIAKNK